MPPNNLGDFMIYLFILISFCVLTLTPLHPNISIDIFHTHHSTFPVVIQGEFSLNLTNRSVLN